MRPIGTGGGSARGDAPAQGALASAMGEPTAPVALDELAALLPPCAMPFPWQRALLAAMVDGQVPDRIDIPTGLGKTAVLAIWLVARAFEPALPTRLVYVVDRRAVVDQATEEAERLAELLAERTSPILAGLRERLGLADGRPLPVSTLRGQHADNEAWRADPSLPAIIVGTVDMIGSRLLFEGYGVSRRMRPYHAGLLGHDALIVLDEAHLVPPFEALIGQIAAMASAAPLPRPRLRTMSLSATGRDGASAALGLEDEDRRHLVVAKRLAAVKAIRPPAATLEPKMVAGELARLAWGRAGQGQAACRVVVFCDSRATAGETQRALQRLADRTPMVSELLVGERRVHERQRVTDWLAAHGFCAGTAAGMAPAGPAFLIATAAGEVGVDLDAEHMVADVVAWERMVQRLGRVNRRGEGAALVDLVLVAVKKADAPEPREQRAAAAAGLLRLLPTLPDGRHNGSPGALTDLKARAATDPALAAQIEAATTPPPLRPALTRALIDAWSMTSLTEHTGRPEIGPWLRGWVEDEPQTTLIWRRFLPWRADDAAPVKAEVDAFFEHAGPKRSEVLEAPVWRALEILRARAAALLHQTPGRREEAALLILSPSLGLEAALTLGRLKDFKGDDAVRRVVDRTLVVAATIGGLSEAGLLYEGAAGDDASPTLEPTDGEPARAALLTLDGGAEMAGGRLRILRHAPDKRPDQEDGWKLAHAWPLHRNNEGETVEEIGVWTSEAARADPALTRNAQGLDDHTNAVMRHADAIALRIGLDAPHRAMLIAAARLHDRGKDRQNWQDAFCIPRNERPGAKSASKWIDQKRLNGYRHEFGSLADAAGDAELLAMDPGLRELALHLIVAHHGRGRPLVHHGGDETVPESLLVGRARDVALRFARLQRRWGAWGLAWWEALLQAADAQASRENDAGHG